MLEFFGDFLQSTSFFEFKDSDNFPAACRRLRKNAETHAGQADDQGQDKNNARHP
jgi:hypothetical protein